MKKFLLFIFFGFSLFIAFRSYKIISLTKSKNVPLSHLMNFKLWMLRDEKMIPSRIWLARRSDPKRIRGLQFVSGIIPQELLEFITWENKEYNFPQPEKFAPSNPEELEFAESLKLALESLPPRIYQAASKLCEGIYLIRGLGSSGYTLSTFDNEGRESGAFMVLDYDFLNKEINEWVNEKEASAFSSWEFRAELNLDTKMSSDKEKKIASIRALLLHEIAHLLTINREGFPPPEYGAIFTDKKLHPFFAIDWFLVSPDQIMSKEKNAVFDGISFYQENRARRNGELPEIYKHLSQSSHVSLYGTLSPHEDFAEAFFIYVHHFVLGYPYETSIYKNSELLFSFSSCLIDQRCPEKKHYVEEFYNQL